jgi:cardiolipin synthase A/B
MIGGKILMILLFILLGLILLIIIWFYLDFRLGYRKHLKIVRKLETPILHGNFDIFPHGKELFADYFNELKNAKQHIHVLFYIAKDDPITHEFFEILKDKAREGLEVRLLLDRIGSISVKKKAVASLREAGVYFAFSNRIKLPFLFYSSQVRNHRKISIIDGEIGYLGGFNVGKEYIDEDPKLSPWRDYHLKITGESVSFLQQEYFVDWQEYGEKVADVTKYCKQLPKGKVRHYFVPTEAGQLESRHLNLIKKANQAIMIGSPYFIPSKKIVHELIMAARRGIEIKIIVPFTADHILVQEASYRYLRQVLRAGVQVFQFKNGFYHAKSIIIDDCICDIGTANFDKRSLFLNKEINCYFLDKEFVARFKEVFVKDIHDSRPLTLSDLNHPNLFRSVKEVIAWPLSYFL